MKKVFVIFFILIGATINMINCQAYTCSNMCDNLLKVITLPSSAGSCSVDSCTVKSTNVDYCLKCSVMGIASNQCGAIPCSSNNIMTTITSTRSNNANGRFRSLNIIYGCLPSLAFVLLPRIYCFNY